MIGMVHNEQTYLELIVGPMFSGKTSKLIEYYRQFKICNIDSLVFNHSYDNRYDPILLSSHDLIKIDCIQTSHLMQHYDEACKAIHKVILINEGQFFDDLIEFVTKLLDCGLPKRIYIAGLDGDSERKKFGAILDLIPLCDNIIKMNSLCGICRDGTKGIFSLRITNETTQISIGASNYIPVCRQCYINRGITTGAAAATTL